MQVTATQNLSDSVLDGAATQTGASLGDLSRQRPQLVVFLRHSGCPFCRQALADLADQREAITAAGTGIILVHMQTDAEAARLFAEYKLDDVPRISDPARKLYEAFEVQRGSLLQVVGPGVWLTGLKSLLTGHLPGVPSADVFQLPGCFLVHDGQIVRAFRGQTSGDRPDYCELARIG